MHRLLKIDNWTCKHALRRMFPHAHAYHVLTAQRAFKPQTRTVPRLSTVGTLTAVRVGHAGIDREYPGLSGRTFAGKAECCFAR